MTAGFIAACYSLTLAAMGVFAWRLVRSGKRLAEQVPDEDKPWI
jgi:hypothetical protein